MTQRLLSLSDKYTVTSGRIYLNGIQALVRLALMQKQRDMAAGLNTAGYVSGYRGSPLGGVDKEFIGAKRYLEAAKIKFHPGINEDLAATAIWGTQQVNLYDGAQYDGVFSMWYGKGPGVDRSGDVFRHANHAGTSANGGVLVLCGDDPACKSSTLPNQSEHALIDASIPIFSPANVQDILDYGMYGFALSRYSGCWVGMKSITENADTSASVDADPNRIRIVIPTDQEFAMPDGGMGIRWPDSPLEQELRLHKDKSKAVFAFAKANRLNKITHNSATPRLGLVTSGKSYLDTLQALSDLGIDQAEREAIGLRIIKIAMPWPLEPEGIRQFAVGLEEVLVIEEKRPVIESQLKELLYNWKSDVQPRIVGKYDSQNDWILPSAGELTPAMIARVIAARIRLFHQSPQIEQRLDFLEAKQRALSDRLVKLDRLPWYCAGCPHNASTKVPEGSRAMAGIGCHYMVNWMDRRTSTFSHMGGEGIAWVGQSPFSDTEHVFSNLGDGTYYHSGILAIRAAVAAGVNITYKILYNDAIAMTGGQPIDGPLDVATVSCQVAAEGVGRIAVATDEPDRYPPGTRFADGVTVHHRREFETLQREFREEPGVTVLIYDQACAAEKRRKRKRGTYPEPTKRVFINKAVCEGCGDCGIQSNCVSLIPVETELGRKRAIDQSACNKDYTCLDGFCPAMVTVENAQLRRPSSSDRLRDYEFPTLPDPTLASCLLPYNIVIAGIGGTGVVTVGAILGLAAHLEGKQASVLDIAGLAQKNGAVYSHARVAENPDDVHAARISDGCADLIIGCDLLTSASEETLGKLQEGRTRAVISDSQSTTTDFAVNPDVRVPYEGLAKTIGEMSDGGFDFIDSKTLALHLLGDTQMANMILVGYAYQKGYLPVAESSILQTIELNNVSVALNIQAFRWGRFAAFDLKSVLRLACLDSVALPSRPIESVDAFVERRGADLVAYQGAELSRQYLSLVERVGRDEQDKTPGMSGMAQAVAQSYFKLLAIKDEYEVARLYSDGLFEQELRETFETGFSLVYHLAPPAFAKRDKSSEKLMKSHYGPWMKTVFVLLAKLKGLRGTVIDVFGKTAERQTERQLIIEFEQTLENVLAKLTPENHSVAVKIIESYGKIRGYGHVKLKAVELALVRHKQLMTEFDGL